MKKNIKMEEADKLGIDVKMYESQNEQKNNT